jgi:hypothetical protein
VKHRGRGWRHRLLTPPYNSHLFSSLSNTLHRIHVGVLSEATGDPTAPARNSPVFTALGWIGLPSRSCLGVHLTGVTDDLIAALDASSCCPGVYYRLIWEVAVSSPGHLSRRRMKRLLPCKCSTEVAQKGPDGPTTRSWRQTVTENGRSAGCPLWAERGRTYRAGGLPSSHLAPQWWLRNSILREGYIKR